MEIVDSIDIDCTLCDEIQSLADLNNMEIEDYITFLLEEEILRAMTVSLVSDSSS